MKISIITATYNSGATLEDTLESILMQTHYDLECIVVDGNSKDNTIDIIKKYEPRFNGRMKWISEPDKGIYDAMNKGLKISTGDVVGFLNSDDFFSTPDILKTVADNIAGVDAVYADVHYVSENNLKRCVRYYSSRRFRPWMMKMGFMPAHPSFYCDRQLYNRLGVFDPNLSVAADFELLLRFIFINKIRTRYIPQDFVTMRTGGASTSGFKSHRRILKDHMNAYRKNSVKSNYLLESCRYFYKVAEISWHKLNMFLNRFRDTSTSDSGKQNKTAIS